MDYLYIHVFKLNAGNVITTFEKFFQYMKEINFK